MLLLLLLLLNWVLDDGGIGLDVVLRRVLAPLLSSEEVEHGGGRDRYAEAGSGRGAGSGREGGREGEGVAMDSSSKAAT